MSKLSAIFVLSCIMALAMALPEPRQQLQHLQHPYLFLSVPRGRANAGAVVHGFEIVEEPDNGIRHNAHDDADDDEDENDDDDDDDNDNFMPMRRAIMADNDDDDEDDMADDDDDDVNAVNKLPRGLSLARNGQLVLLNDEQHNDDDDDNDNDDVPLMRAKSGHIRKSATPSMNGQPLLNNAKPTQMMVARDQAGAIMVPDGIVEIEGQSIVDEKTGKAALLVPRAALDAIPDGAVVALMERALNNNNNNNDDDDDDAVEEERANRVIVRRRKNNGRRNGQRRRVVRPNNQVRRRRVNNNNQRRRRVNPNNNNNNRRRNVRVVRPSGNRRRGNPQRRRGQLMLQG